MAVCDFSGNAGMSLGPVAHKSESIPYSLMDGVDGKCLVIFAAAVRLNVCRVRRRVDQSARSLIMSIHLPNSLTRSAIIHGAVLGLTAGLIGSALAVQNPPNNRPVPPPPNEKPRLPATVPPANATATDRLYAGWSTHPLGA